MELFDTVATADYCALYNVAYGTFLYQEQDQMQVNQYHRKANIREVTKYEHRPHSYRKKSEIVTHSRPAVVRYGIDSFN
jgi:hypothetical protein